VRLLLGAFGDPGHAFPMIALGRALRARGHDVTLQTWTRWQADVAREGLRFAPAPEYHVFPTRQRPLKPFEAVARATRDTLPLVRELRPDAVVADVLTLAPALAAELEGVAVATLVPHVDPRGAPGFPPFSVGARLPRTAAGRALWGALEPLTDRGLELGRVELNETRRRLGLPALAVPHGNISARLALIATFPQLEYPRAWPGGAEVIGPLLWEPPTAEIELPPGDGPLVLVAPSTSQDAEHRLVRAAIRGLGGVRGLRVLAIGDAAALGLGGARPSAVTLVPWASYARTMPRCEVVVCHAGHGTLARALASGCVVVCAPMAGDMNECAARADWAGCGVRIPRRLIGPRALRLAVARALGEPGLRARAGELASWYASADPAGHGALLIEDLAAGRR
jgi:UDP:flavonoid glycosyltransferase YjiC (YdhE family)